ncbi:MAG: class I SAM-dependent methyltransferase [Ruminococcaceae bacterium]|nr:class I SAM-dependent methyltransferase [Oscillospiraceae bacterium]
MNGYRALAECYDRLMETDYGVRADYLLSLFRKHGARVQTLLDLACGSGSLTAALCERGIDMIGVDLSQDMLALAAEKCPDSLLLCQDMRKLDLYDVVDGAVCTLDSLNHLLRTADLSAVFARLRLFIAPQGLFIFDVNTPYKHRCILGDNTFVLEDDEVLCVWQNALDDKTCTVDMALDFFWEGEDGRYDRTSDTVRERAYTQKTWTRLLNDAGFEVLAVYADLTEESPQEDCARWVFVARNTRPAEEYA